MRDDYRTASIVAALWNIARDVKRHPRAMSIEDFRLHFGDDEGKPAPKKQTWQAQKSMASSMVNAFNKAVASGQFKPDS